MSVAKSCEKDGLVSSFFFFRSDPKRNNHSALVLSIAHGLVVRSPSCRTSIHERISGDPMILEASMEEQFQELVLRTFTSYPPRKLTLQNWLRRAREGWSKGPPLQKEDPDLVLIDGLDECSDEETQLRSISTIQSAFRQSPHFPLRFLICSRPEAWLQEVFAAESLRQLSKIMVLDESFSPSEDIMQYYLHRFQEITHNPKYKHVQFPSPWPSKADLEALVIRTCGQFVYAVTVIKFIMGAFKHPIEQLRIILEDVPPRSPGASPYRQLDTLYDYILGVNPDYEEALPIQVAAILNLPDYLKPTPTHIELLFGLRAGQVALTLRAMCSVLDIRGSADPILVFHTSFSDYLVQQTRSHRFHVDIETQEHAIARCWLQNLTTSKVQTYSFDRLYDDEIGPFITQWIEYCTLMPKPTRQLVDDMRNVDLAYVFFRHSRGSATSYFPLWDRVFHVLASWVGKHDDDGKEVETDCREAVKHGAGLDLAEGLVYRLQNTPERFHLEWPPGVSPHQDEVYWVVHLAAQCEWRTRLFVQLPFNGPRQLPHLTDCHCDLAGREVSRDPGHTAYQEACKQLVEAYVFLFEDLLYSGAEDEDTIHELEGIFLNLVQSSILRHHPLDTKLVSLCQTVFGLAKRCLSLRVWHFDGARGRANLLQWIEAFPDRFADEGEALRTQVLTLPWRQWSRNWDDI